VKSAQVLQQKRAVRRLQSHATKELRIQLFGGKMHAHDAQPPVLRVAERLDALQPVLKRDEDDCLGETKLDRPGNGQNMGSFGAFADRDC
jgi:hypothetical protein